MEYVYSKNELLQMATGCMWEGLPNKFHSARVKFIKKTDENLIKYECEIQQGDKTQEFRPGDDLYPVKCIHQLDRYLPEDKQNWKECKIEFNPRKVELEYFY